MNNNWGSISDNLAALREIAVLSANQKTCLDYFLICWGSFLSIRAFFLTFSLLRSLFFTLLSLWLSLHCYSKLSLSAEAKIHAAQVCIDLIPFSASLLRCSDFFHLLSANKNLSVDAFYILSCTPIFLSVPLPTLPWRQTSLPTGAVLCPLSRSLSVALCKRQNCLPVFQLCVSTATSKNNRSRQKYKNSLFEALRHISEAFEDVTVCICWFDTELKWLSVHFVNIFNHRHEVNSQPTASDVYMPTQGPH